MHPPVQANDLTAEQKAIVAHARAGDSLRVLALAGTGKTSTLVEISKAVRTQGLYLAFNRAIAAEARRKFPPHVLVKTAHALAYAALGHRFQSQGRIENSTWALRQAVLERFGSQLVDVAGAKRISSASFAVLDTLGSFLASPADRVCADHVPPENELDHTSVAWLTQAVFDAMVDERSTFPTNHDAYLKAWALTRPRLPFTILYFDEAQDANDVLVDLVQRQTHLQRIWVGDENQAIYSFRHAVNALASIDLPAYPLTQSWRFGPKVAKIANAILWAKDEPLRVRGRADRDDRIAAVDVADVVLARTNAGLFEEAVSLLSRLTSSDRLAFVGGVDDVVNMVMAAFELQSNGRTRHPGFRFFRKWTELRNLVENGQGGEFAPFVKLVERHGTDIPAMCAAVRGASVPDERAARVLFSTAHGFKGREKPTVRLAGDFPEFCGFNFKKRRIEFRFEEANLAYVAVTRAEQILDLGGYRDVLLASIENRKRLPGSARDFAV